MKHVGYNHVTGGDAQGGGQNLLVSSLWRGKMYLSLSQVRLENIIMKYGFLTSNRSPVMCHSSILSTIRQYIQKVY